jgi:hypothetical protein
VTARTGQMSYRGVESFKWKELPFLRRALRWLTAIISLEGYIMEKADQRDEAYGMHALLAFGRVE